MKSLATNLCENVGISSENVELVRAGDLASAELFLPRKPFTVIGFADESTTSWLDISLLGYSFARRHMGVVRAVMMTCGEGKVVSEELQHISKAGVATQPNDDMPQLDCVRVRTWRVCNGERQDSPWNAVAASGASPGRKRKATVSAPQEPIAQAQRQRESRILLGSKGRANAAGSSDGGAPLRRP